MTRKDSEKDSERPHYYSQFWLDVAAGRRIIGTPKPAEEGESGDTETPELTPLRKTGRASEQELPRGTVDEYAPEPVHVSSTSEPVEEYASPDIEEEEEDSEYPQDVPPIDDDIPDFDDISDEDIGEEAEEEDFFDEEEEEEEEEDWRRGGRKKAKPTRPIKPPSKRTSKRDSRRSY